MFRNNIFIILLFGSLCASVTTAGAEVIFSDSFESSDMLATNPDGFSWDKNNKTSVVTQDAVDGPVAIYNNGTIYNPHDPLMPDGSIRDWTAKDANNSLRFRYSAGDPWTEQRYDFGKGYPELWVAYWIRVPKNYVRGPIFNGGGNNKWFNIQMAPMTSVYYQDPTVSRIEMQDWTNSDDAGSMDLNIQFRNGSDGKYRSSASYRNFVTPADAGRWMHLIYYLKTSKTTSSTDGILRLYRRWEDENRYTLTNEIVDLNVGIGAGSVSAGYLGWGGGYLMGYLNSPYTNDTEWLLDSFTVSNTSLLPNPPLPPSNVTGNSQ